MRYLFIILLVVMLISELAGDQDIDFKIYDSQGNEVGMGKIIDRLLLSDIVFFGELHGIAAAHQMELEITRVLHRLVDKGLVLGAEMFESDNQLVMDEYLQGLITTGHFEDNMRLWNNYDTDYKPLVEFACENGLQFIATNIPRRYASLVAREGFEGLDNLSDLARSYIAPLPVEYDPELECYSKMKEMSGMPAKMHSGYLPEAQAIKDATMAYNIAQNVKKDGIFFHINGRYHSDYHQGIIWYLQRYAPEKRIVTISTVIAEDLSVPDADKAAADFIIVLPRDSNRND
jgi:uncharacterized iron-regulated protein